MIAIADAAPREPIAAQFALVAVIAWVVIAGFTALLTIVSLSILDEEDTHDGYVPIWVPIFLVVSAIIAVVITSLAYQTAWANYRA